MKSLPFASMPRVIRSGILPSPQVYTKLRKMICSTRIFVMTDNTDKNINLQGHLDVPPERMDAVLSAVTYHITLTLAEEGCLSFEVIPCSDVQGRFLVAETFKNRAAFDQHQTRTKASPWAKITAGLPRDYKITEGS